LSVIQDHGAFVSYSAADWREAGDDAIPFVLPGLMSTGVTQVYGKSEAGKSMFVSGMVGALVSGTPFLGISALPADYNAGILVGDTGDGGRYTRRLDRILAKEDMRKIRIYDPTRKGMPFEDWGALITACRNAGHNILVIDSLSIFAPGDLNSGPVCNTFYDYTTHFTAQGIAVITVAHSTEKYSQFGTQDFIGHSAIRQRPNWHVRIRDNDGQKRLWCHGNDDGEQGMLLAQPDPKVPAYDVLSATTPDELAEKRETKRRNRSPETRDGNAEIAGWVSAAPGRTQRMAAEHFGVSLGKVNHAIKVVREQADH
jgi:hypothetical protein